MAKKKAKSLHETYGEDAPAVLRGVMADQAETVEIPSRFVVTQRPGEPRVTIHDTLTKRSCVVPMFAYLEVRHVLSELFYEL